eukprot:3146915-Pleurochrysis_carterae.AAC.1
MASEAQPFTAREVRELDAPNRATAVAEETETPAPAAVQPGASALPMEVEPPAPAAVQPNVLTDSLSVKELP